MTMTPAETPTAADPTPTGRRRRGTLRKAAFWLPLALLWGAPLAGVLLLTPAADKAEADAATAPLPATVEVGARERTGTRSVTVGFDVVTPPAPFIALDGRVTALRYTPGKTLAEGDALVEIDGMTVRAHRGDRPFHRDIEQGTSGKDVRELARYLTAAGVKGATLDRGDTAGRALVDAIRGYEKSNGMPADGIFRPGYVVHLDATTLRLAAPAVSVGVRVTDGTVLAPGDGVADGGAVRSANGDVVAPDVPGPYVLTGPGDLRLPVDAVTFEGEGAEKVRAALRTAAVTSMPPNDMTPQETFSGLSLSAAEPVAVGAVAATAIHAGPGGAFCVFRLAPGAKPETATAVRLEVATTLDGETTIAAIDHALVGESVARVAAHLPASVKAGCS